MEGLLSTGPTPSSFCCPECKEDLESESVLDKHNIKYDVYDNILDFADIPFKLSDRIGPNLKDLDGEEHPKKKLTQRKKSTNHAIIQKKERKPLIEEICLECSICNSTYCWQNGLRDPIKSMLNEKFNC